MIKGQFPIDDLPKSRFEWIADVIAALLLIAMTALIIINYRGIPDRVATHFNFQGTPDAFGNKITLIIWPFLGLTMFALLTAVARHPRLMNYPVVITKNNAAKQLRLARNLLAFIKIVISSIFFHLSYVMINVSKSGEGGLKAVYLPAVLVAVFGAIVVYLYLSIKNNRDNG